MLLALIFATAAAGASPVPTATPEPLKTIAIVHSSSACSEIAKHANAAITSALTNDGSLTATIKAMQASDLDSNVIKHRNALDALGEYAKTINLQAVSGDAEIKRLRKLADEATDPARKKDLTAFANWLGGAMWRQRTIARDLNGMLAAVDMRDMIAPDDGIRQMSQAFTGNTDALQFTNLGAGPLRSLPVNQPGGPFAHLFPPTLDPPTLATMSAAAARDFALRLPAIANDESMAAGHVTGAFNGC